MKTKDQSPFTHYIDSIGQLQAEISVLEEQVEKYKQAVLEYMRTEELKHLNGSLFGATYVTKDYGRTDWKAVATKLRPPRQLVTAHTKTVHSEYIQVGIRKKTAA